MSQDTTSPAPRSPAIQKQRWTDSPFVSYLVVAACAVYLYLFAFSHWMPHDEGALALSANRIQEGELPHRDFEVPYTCGLSYWNSWSFQILGTRLTSIRWFLFLTALPWLACVFWIAGRVTNRLGAALLLMLATTWSLPNYFAALPSWYLLIFGTFGIAATIRFAETDRMIWLIMAGICGGIGILFKVHAVFYIGGVLLYLVFHNRGNAEKDNATAKRDRLFAIFVSVISVAFLLLQLALIRRHWGVMELLTYVVPTALLLSVLLLPEWRDPRGTFLNRFVPLTRDCLAFVVGSAMPVALLIGAFWRAGALEDLYQGVVALPQQFVAGGDGASGELAPNLQRYLDAVTSHALPPIQWLLPAMPVALLLVFGGRMSLRADKRVAWTIGWLSASIIPALGFILGRYMRSVVGSSNQALIYQTVCFSVRSLLPLVTWGIAYHLLRRRNEKLQNRRQLFLLAMCTTVMSLVQYPYATAVYFFYVAPLVFLTLQAFVALQGAPGRCAIVLAITYVFFAVPFLNRGYNRSHGVQFIPAPRTSRLEMPRGGLRVFYDDRRVYEQLVREIESHTKNGEAIFAGPECPVVYFLSGRPNPTRPFFDLFAHPETQAEEIMTFLREKNIRLVVINNRPEFSVPVGDKLKRMLTSEYPNETTIREFQVRWREETTER